DEAWARALLAAERRYRPRKFKGTATTFFTSKSSRSGGGPALGWDRHVSGAVDSVLVAGDHLSMLLEPDVELLARELADRVAAAHATSVGRRPGSRMASEQAALRAPLNAL